MITFTRGSASVELPNPELGNSDTIQTGLTYNIMMDGAFRSYVQSTKLRRLLLTFNLANCENYVEELLEFYLEYAGDEITYTDYNNVDWIGHIVSNPIQERRALNYTEVIIEFVGYEYILSGGS